MKLVRVLEKDQSSGDSRTTRFAFAESDTLLRLLPSGSTFAEALDALQDEGTVETQMASFGDWSLLAPVPSPASVRDCVGFLQHIRNSRRNRGDLTPLLPVWDERPAFYFANPHSLRSATDDVAIPAGSQSFDFELEIAVVVGEGGRDLAVEEASAAIAGYVLFCDWSARDIQADERAMQIGLGKAKDAAISLGPWIVSARSLESVRRRDGLDILVGAEVNGERVTGPEIRYTGMDWSFEEIVAYASIGAELVAGDVIAAGTVPTGCLLESAANEDFRGWLAAGDQVRLSAGPLGEITSTMVVGAASTAWRRP